MHDAQIEMLKRLLFAKYLSYTELQKYTNLASDHVKYHINRLLDRELVSKPKNGRYVLTAKGKEFANRVDLHQNVFERQPKVSVLLLAERVGSCGVVEHLFQQRFKDPFAGFWGRFGGMVRWGETFEDAAARIFKEETGLIGVFEYAFMVRKFDSIQENLEVQEDKIFILLKAKNISGNLVSHFDGGRNMWMTREELESQDKYFPSATEFIDMANSRRSYFTLSREFLATDY